MSRPKGIEQKYYDHFKRGGSWGSADQDRYDNYMKATKGLDKDLAWKALDGGQGFDRQGGDMQRYNALVQAREKAKAQKNKTAAPTKKTPVQKKGEVSIQPVERRSKEVQKIEKLQQRVQNKNERMQRRNKQIANKDAKIERKGEKIANKNEMIEKKNIRIENQKKQITNKKEKLAKAKGKVQAFKQANEAYFADAQKRSGIKDNTAAHLKAEFDKQTAGLDKELAFKALDGGRMFGESDMARYNALLAEKNNTKADNNKGNVNVGDGNTQVSDALNDNKGIIGDGNQQLKNSGNVDGERNMGGIGNVNTDNSFNAEDITATIGKQGDMNTTIGDNNQFGAGSSIGNDYSVTVGNMRFGNNGEISGSSDNALSNMQSATAYNALNNNFLQRSKSQLSGYGRAAGAIEEATKANAKPNSDQASAFNFAGKNQNYLRDKMEQIRSRYMGSMDGYQAPSFNMPISPRPVDLDPAKDIYEDALGRF